ILYNDNYEIEWINPYMKHFTEEEIVIGKSLNVISEKIIQKIVQEETQEEVEDDHKKEFKLKIEAFEYSVFFDKERQLLYFFDKTRELSLELENYKEQTVIDFIYLDNYDEISRNMTDR